MKKIIVNNEILHGVPNVPRYEWEAIASYVYKIATNPLYDVIRPFKNVTIELDSEKSEFIFTKLCPLTSEKVVRTYEVKHLHLIYVGHAYLQTVLSSRTPEDREFLQSLMTPAMQKKIFDEEE